MAIETPDLETQVQPNVGISDTYAAQPSHQTGSSTGVLVAVAAAMSAVVGGLAAAWYYRRTLSRLQHAESVMHNSKFGISDPADDEEL